MTAMATPRHRVSVAVAHAHTELDSVADASVWSMEPSEIATTLVELSRLKARVAELEARVAEHADDETIDAWAHQTRQTKPAVLGQVNLGHALANYSGFSSRGFRTVALLDADASRQGEIVAGLEIRAFDDLDAVVSEHGVGIEKLASMCVQFSPAEREQMLALKRAFDPKGLLNPGKVIPTLVRCAEYGKMHVKRGLLPFADLPRF